jgi:hypothetical protein
MMCLDIHAIQAGSIGMPRGSVCVLPTALALNDRFRTSDTYRDVGLQGPLNVDAALAANLDFSALITKQPEAQ